jgi:serine/threonine-protein kinase RsbW
VWHTIPMATEERFSTTVDSRDDVGPQIVAALKVTERFARSANLAPIAAARLSVVVEELVSNTLRHGADGAAITVEFTLTAADGLIRLCLADDCPPFDPTRERQFDGPDRDSGGGVGLALIRAWAREAAYARESGRNHVRLVLPSSE